MIHICQGCGLPAIYENMRCICGATWTIESPVEEAIQVCIHMSEEAIARAECGCGPIHECKLLKKLCSLKKPLDEWVYAGDIRLSAESYQCCGECQYKELKPCDPASTEAKRLDTSAALASESNQSTTAT